LILAYQALQEVNLGQKSPGPPGWGLMQQASPVLIEKENCYIYDLAKQVVFYKTVKLSYQCKILKKLHNFLYVLPYY